MKMKCYVFMLIALAVGFTACSSDDDEYEIGNQEQDVFVPIDLCNPNTVLSPDLKSAFARIKVNIRYQLESGVVAESAGFFDDTKVYVRSVKCSGFSLRGTLKKSSIASGSPVWTEFQGQRELSFNPIVFHDGRKDGKEGSAEGEQADETNQLLNPAITENYAVVSNGKYSTGKNPGITNQELPLFKFSTIADAGDGYFYVIPRHQHTGVDFDIVYYVETINANLPGLLSDGETHGALVVGNLSKRNVLGPDVDFEPGKAYQITIIIGSENPKIEVVTTD